jgi:hypothetical protein
MAQGIVQDYLEQERKKEEDRNRKETLQIIRFTSLSSHRPHYSALPFHVAAKTSEVRLALIRIQNQAKESIFREYNRFYCEP